MNACNISAYFFLQDRATGVTIRPHFGNLISAFQISPLFFILTNPSFFISTEDKSMISHLFCRKVPCPGKLKIFGMALILAGAPCQAAAGAEILPDPASYSAAADYSGADDAYNVPQLPADTTAAGQQAPEDTTAAVPQVTADTIDGIVDAAYTGQGFPSGAGAPGTDPSGAGAEISPDIDMTVSGGFFRDTDVVFVLDLSGSMVRTDPDGHLKEAILQSVSMLSSGGGRAAVVPFADSLGTVFPMTDLSGEGYEACRTYLEGLEYTSGDTDIGAALEKAIEIQGEEGARSDRRILIFTDGVIDLPKARDESAAEKDSLTKALISAESAREGGMVIDSAAIGAEGSTDDNLLGYLAERTGGRFVQEDAGIDLFQTISGFLLNQSGGSAGGDESAEHEAAESETSSLYTEQTESEWSEDPFLDQTEEDLWDMTETEAFTEAETEAETRPSAPKMTGKIGETMISGLCPMLCRSQVDLRNLFDFEDETGITFSVKTDEGAAAKAEISNTTLKITGKAAGRSRVTVTASAGGEKTETSFFVQISPTFPSNMVLPGAAGAIALIIGGLILMAKRGQGGGSAPASGGKELCGRLSYYVKMEGRKIFGVPTQNTVNLDGLGRSVRLSDLIEDPYLASADLKKVWIHAASSGMMLASKSGRCLIQDENGEIQKNLCIEENPRFRVLCAVDGGKAAIVCVFSSGPEDKDDCQGEERTRLLV